MKSSYCYWSVATGTEAAEMADCIRTARESGVFKKFHVLTDSEIEEAECYEAHECDRAQGLYKLHYLKVGMSRLNVDWFVWVDPATRFSRQPVDMLGVVGRAPIHVPLEAEIANLPERVLWSGMPLARLGEFMRQHGVYNPPYVNGSSFWIVHHDVIDLVYDLAIGFWHKAKEEGLNLDVAGPLGFAAQLLMADCERHRLAATTDLWGPCPDLAENRQGEQWEYRHPAGGDIIKLRPAIRTWRRD